MDENSYSDIYGYGFRYKRMAFDDILIVPPSTSPQVPFRSGAVRYNDTASALEIWDGSQWNEVTGADQINGGAMFPLFTPGSFSAVAASSTQINLSWSSVPNVDLYVIDWSPDGLTGWTQLYSGAGTSTSHTGLTTATTYYYRIRATATGMTDSSYATDNETTP